MSNLENGQYELLEEIKKTNKQLLIINRHTARTAKNAGFFGIILMILLIGGGLLALLFALLFLSAAM